MESTWTVVDRGSQSRGRSLGMLLVLPLMMAIAWCTPGVARHALLTIALTYTLITAHWAVLRLIMDSPLPADLCQRCRRGLITRVAANRHGDRFYQCASCGARYRRESRSGPWRDASGQVYDVMYSRSEREGLDAGARHPIDDSRYWTETVSVLLRNKRIREITGSRGPAASKKLARIRPSVEIGTPGIKPDVGPWDLDLS